MSTQLRKVGVYHHPTQPAAREMAEHFRVKLEEAVPDVWISSAWDPVTSVRDLDGTDLLICIGGDGTVLRGSRAVIPHPTLILGVDMGRLAFLTEVTPAGLDERLPDLLAGRYHIEERTMLDVEFRGFDNSDAPQNAHALNDVILGRTSLGRPVYINVKVDGDLVGVIRADAIVVSTATGSTGYSLSAGGPILAPRSRSLVITPVAPHLAAAAPLVLPRDAVVELSPGSDSHIAASVDGQGQFSVALGDVIIVRRSRHIARMVRFGEKPFFAQVGRRLAWLDERRLRAVSEGDLDSSLPPHDE